MSSAQPPSFMLLPDYTHLPGKTIHLGTILPLSDEAKLANPDLPLNASTLTRPTPSEIYTSTEQPYSFTQNRSHSGSLSLDADLSVFSPVSGGVGFSRKKTTDIKISCEKVETERFAPTTAYLSKVLKDEVIQDYCRQHWFPSVFLVAGLKVAYNAVVERGSGSGRGGHVGASVDATSVGVPVNVGPSVEGAVDGSRRIESKVAGPFILAYQLKRLKLKGDGRLKKMEGWNKTAPVYEESIELATDTPEQPLAEEWDVEDVVPDTEFYN